MSSGSTSPRACVLVVDDEPDVREVAALTLSRDFDLLTAEDGPAALALLDRKPVAVLATDHYLPGMTGLELIRAARARHTDLATILLTGRGDHAVAVDAINVGGISRYLPKPFDPRELREAIRHAVEARELTLANERLHAENARLVSELSVTNERLASEKRYLQQEASAGAGFAQVIGGSLTIRRAIVQAQRVADSATTVLLEGPTGSGKELFARAIHASSRRRDALFVAVNCGTMNDELLASTLFGHRKGAFTGAVSDQKGLFELAHGGTLFLDEIGETSLAMQVHLLRVLQEGELMSLGARQPTYVDVRVIAASNRDLREATRSGRFRPDLLHRLRVFPIHLPPLGARREDIPELARHLVVRLAARANKPVPDFTPGALNALVRHDYEGHVRELANLIERALLLVPPGDPITEDDLFERIPTWTADADNGSLRDAVGRFEQERIREALTACGGNKTHAAHRLGLTYRGLLMKMQRYGMGTATRADD